jgi:hypothetical protein
MHVAQLRQSRRRDSGQGLANALDLGTVRAEKLVLQFTESEVGDAGKGLTVDVVVDAHHRIDVALTIGERMVVKVLQCQTGQDGARHFPFDLAGTGQSCMPVACLGEIGRSQQSLQAGEGEIVIEVAAAIRLFRLGGRDRNLLERRETVHESPPGRSVFPG